MSALFSSPPSIPKAIVPGPAPQKTDAETLADANAARQRLAGAQGRSSTILTAPDTTAQTPTGKTLLGAG